MFRFVAISLVLTVSGTFAIQCHTGLKFIKGTSVGTATVNCDNSAAYCYNMTASTAALIEVTKAGCSMWRCMVVQLFSILVGLSLSTLFRQYFLIVEQIDINQMRACEDVKTDYSLFFRAVSIFSQS